MNKIYFYLFLLLLGSCGVALKFSTSFERMPIGCDEFGYLNLAKSMDAGKTFTNHSPRPYLPKLIDTLRIKGITENEIAWMVGPHAYHLIPNTYQLINQYPPGTSYLLSLLPQPMRQKAFPALIIIALILCILIAIKSCLKKPFNYFDLVFPPIIFLMMVAAPFTTELSRINSLAPTFGLLLAGGMLLRKRPFMATLFIALSINFRIANALMVFPILLFLPWKDATSINGFRANLIILGKYLSLLVAATLPLLLYNYFLTGHPFSTTYSSIDTSMQQSVGVFKNLIYYISMDHWWFRVHVLGLVILILFLLKRQINLPTLLLLFSFMVLNYIFFGFHQVTMDYYPYASSLILFGFALSLMAENQIAAQLQMAAKLFFLLTTFLIVGIGFQRYSNKTHITYETALQQYQVLCEFNVVWADLYSGTSEYVCNNDGFRYGTTTPRARKISMLFLKANNIKQAILLDDSTVDSAIILKEVKEINLNSHVEENNTVGRILIIE
ncbi:MAG: hypothetical protein IPP71_02125 [Bacteroidetes bacterium]|nr:hypothetical protein [Bacteroidota bacterium]